MTKKPQTASFMVRFTQNIYDENGESKVQWRGNVSHVQGGEDVNFSDFKDAVAFIQQHLTALTQEATSDKTSEEQENILMKSLSLFKTVASTGPKLIKETLKDPRKQVASLQDQLTEYGEELWEKVPIDQWRNASKSDFHSIEESIKELAGTIATLTEKVDAMQAANTRNTTSKAKKTPSKAK